MPSLKQVFKAFRELGWRQTSLFGLYQLEKRSGFFKLNPRPLAPSKSEIAWPAGEMGPDPAEYRHIIGGSASRLRAEADRILQGHILLFGALPADLDFSPGPPLRHWTAYEAARLDGKDIKLIWEPARFSWAVTLARAFRLSGDPAYRDFFNRQMQDFFRASPAYRGPHWANGQEVALRLIHLAFAQLVFGEAGGALAEHAHRIPATLIYARAQNNNHLLSEAAGLLTAGVLLKRRPDTRRWLESGWTWLNRGLQAQIEADGAYMQQSVNYHRMVLLLALWGGVMAQQIGRSYPAATRQRLAASTAWLLKLCDPESGRVPNLGPNDGAFILPLSQSPFHDFRPVLQAAARSFLGEPAFPSGPWDETAAWLYSPNAPQSPTWPAGPLVLKHPQLEARAFLRAARFKQRPGHADQLHLDLWWREENIARDPGTFQYNARPPWDNALQSAQHHNTITVDGRDQMTRAGRFLYVDRAQATVLESQRGLSAEHDGYRRLGIRHRRTLEATATGWQVQDHLFAAGSVQAVKRHALRMHWLLPDYPWSLQGGAVLLEAPSGRIEIRFALAPPAEIAWSLIRAGKYVHGTGPPAPTMGWFSPTYALREPALSLVLETMSALPVRWTTNWHLIPNP